MVYKKGFTILEIILAIFILTTAIFGSFALIQQTVAGASLNQSKLIAYYLAQEGIENVKNIRDTNWLQGEDDWAAGMPTEIETIGNLTKNFTRETDISSGAGSDFLDVKITIEWSERGKEHSIETVSRLYNWFK